MTQCSTDADCSSCGDSHACVGQDDVTRLCVNKGSNAPADPPHRASAVDWPQVIVFRLFCLTSCPYVVECGSPQHPSSFETLV